MTERPPRSDRESGAGSASSASNEPRRLVWGTAAVQVAKAGQVVAAVVVGTALARTFSLAEFGVYGLTLSFTLYVSFLLSSVEAAAIKVVAEATDGPQRDRAYTTAVVVYVAIGCISGLAIAGIGNLAIGLFDIPASLRTQSREGVVALGLLLAVGWPLRASVSVLYGEQRYRLAALTELLAHLGWMVLMVVLIFVVKPPVWLMITGGASDLVLVGVTGAIAMRALRLGYHFRRAAVDRAHMRSFLSFTGYTTANSVTDVVIYGLDRAVLGAFRPASVIGLYEGINRPHSLIRQIQGTALITVFPATARYLAEGDLGRTRALFLRGTRYVVAATLPPVIALMVLARPLLVAWLGPRFAPASTALTIYLSYWVLNSSVGVGATMLQAAGRVRALAGWAWTVALANLAISLALTPALGLKGVVLGTTIGWAITSPILLRLIVTTLPVSLGDFAREVWLPTYGVGLVVAGGLLIVDKAVGIHGVGPVIVAMSVTVLAYWLLFWALCLRPGEREFFRSLISRPRRRGAEVGLIPRP